MTNPKVLVTGGNAGLGLDIVKHYNGTSMSRSTNHDINDPISRNIIASASLDYDIFFNNAHAAGSFAQTLLLKDVYDLWKKKGHDGLIINMGSYSTYNIPPTWRPYAIFKTALDTLSRQITKECVSRPLPFRNTLIRVGYLDTPKKKTPIAGMTGNDLIQTFDYLYNTNMTTYEIITEKKHVGVSIP